jgi:hypothetical protein
MPGKQRSFSMDLSPSEPPFVSMAGPSAVWSLPSPSSLQHVTSHDVSIENAQSTPDGKLMNGMMDSMNMTNFILSFKHLTKVLTNDFTLVIFRKEIKVSIL